MNFIRTLVLLWLVTVALDARLQTQQPAAPASAPQTSLVRVAVFDCSGSMGEKDRTDKKIETAKRELSAQADATPPSPQHPFILVPFRAKAEIPAVFRDRGSFDRYLAALHADGGTSIAAGLRCGTEQLTPFRDTSQVCLILISDGEDNDDQGIATAEDYLNCLFEERKVRGLSNVVFAKTWGGANKVLVDKIRDRGNAHVVNIGEGDLWAVSIDPVVELLDSNWSSAQSGLCTLRARFALRGQVRGSCGGRQLRPLRVRATSPGFAIEGTTDVELPLDGADNRTEFELLLPIAPGRATARVAFAFEPFEPMVFPRGSINMTLDRTRQDVDITLPILEVHPGRTEVTVRPFWVHVAEDLAEFEVVAHVKVLGHLPADVDVRIQCTSPATQVVPQSVQLTAGDNEIPLRLRTRLVAGRPQSFELLLTTAPSTTGLLFQCSGPIRIEVEGPPPLRLALAIANQSPAPMQAIYVSESAHDGLVQMLPIVLDGAQVANGIPIQLRTLGSQPLGLPQQLTVGTPISANVSGLSGTVLRDQCYDFTLEIRPAEGITSLLPSQQTVRVIVEASLKKLILVAASLMALGCLVFVVVRMLTGSANRSDESTAPPADDRAEAA